MKENLKKIFQDISKGKLTQTEALEKIKTIKLQEQGKVIGTMLYTPVWRKNMPVSESEIQYTEHHIILCEVPKLKENEIKRLLPGCHFISLSSGEDQSIADRYESHAMSCFDYLQQILSNKPYGNILIQIVVGNDIEQVVFMGLSGLLQTATLENPVLKGQIIRTHFDIGAKELSLQLQENVSSFEDHQIKYDQNIRYVLKREEIQASDVNPKIAFKDRGVYLITGGMGGLGILFTKEILKQTTHSRVIVTGRSALTTERKVILEALPVRNNTVEYRQLDLSNLEQVNQLIITISKEYKQLNGILHCAGMTSDNFIVKKTRDEFGGVLIPKVTGTFNLDQASKDIDLDFLVLFSSVASQIGNVGQADYAAANGFMDQFAVYRNQLVQKDQRQGQTLSINWPLWQDGGMQIDQASQEILKQTMQIQPMETIVGMHAFYCSLELNQDQALVIKGDLFQLHDNKKIDQEIINSPMITNKGHSDLFEKTEDYLCKEFSLLLKLTSRKIDPQEPLEKYGIDSILAMKFTSLLEETFGALPKTLFFEYQTIRELTEYFLKSYQHQLTALFNTTSGNNISIEESADIKSGTDERKEHKLISGKRFNRPRPFIDLTNSIHSASVDPIAIVGLSGRYPNSVDIAGYWDNLKEGRDCITEIPKNRWDWRAYYSEDRSKSGYHYSKWGGFIEGVDEFDPRFFNISPREAASIDPQERLFLQHSWKAIEDAGYTRSSLQIPRKEGLAGQVGVYAGVMYGEYNLSGSLASIANRVSYFLNLHGPSMTLDTMCSSSLTSIHLACQDLKEGRTDLGIAGGVNVSIHPNKYQMLSSGQFISSAGHCQSFGEGGDGYIPGEGVGVVVLKRLSEAKRDGNHIYGVIKGSSLNHGGKTNGYSVPNPKAQASAITEALKISDTDPRHISYIEAHGTGTKLGDPIEIAALSKAFEGNQTEKDKGYCLLGSAKSNIGHCESAAGIAGLTKIVLQMAHGKIVPSLHSKRLNPHIDFDNTPFIVNQELRDWDPPVVNGKELPRIAGISSFGAGGSNAHIILEEYINVDRPVLNTDQVIDVGIVLSARTSDQLRQKTVDLLGYLGMPDQECTDIDLTSMSYTLQVGREAMDKRLGLVVSSIVELKEKLESYLDDTKEIEEIYQGEVKRDGDFSGLATDTVIQEWISDKKIAKLLDVWVKGYAVDWHQLYGDVLPGLMSLPTYPFARERYWTAVSDTASQVENNTAVSVLHPLVHSNISDLKNHKYSSTFSGDAFFISSLSNGHKEISVTVYLEMARAAIAEALPKEKAPYFLEFSNTVWSGPLIFRDDIEVHIALFKQTEEGVCFEVYSGIEEKEVIYCQGEAIVHDELPLTTLDIKALRAKMERSVLSSSHQNITSIFQGDKQLLAELNLPEELLSEEEVYVLHPAILKEVLQSGLLLFSGTALEPTGIDSLQIKSSCTANMWVWVRYSSGRADALDIDLCDQEGKVCVQLYGVGYQEVVHDFIEETFNQQEVVKPSLNLEEIQRSPQQLSIPISSKIVLENSEVEKFIENTLEKPTQILLVTPGTSGIEEVEDSVLDKTTTTLSDITPYDSQRGELSNASLIKLFDHDKGLYSLVISAPDKNTLSSGLISELVEALAYVKEISSLKVLLLRGGNVFLQGDRTSYNESVRSGLYQAIASFPFPIIAEMKGSAIGAGFLIGGLCDFMMCSEESKYSFTNYKEGFFPGVEEELWFKERFGNAFAYNFLYQSEGLTGKGLQKQGCSCPILALDQVSSFTESFALDLCEKSRDALQLLKQHLGRKLFTLTEQLVVVPTIQVESTVTIKPRLTFDSKYLKLEADTDHVLTITLHTGGKNCSLENIISGLKTIFTQLDKDNYYKVIVLTSDIADFVSVSDLAGSQEVVLEFQDLILESPLPIVVVINSNAKDIGWLISSSCDVCIYHAQGEYSVSGLIEVPELAMRSAMLFSHRLGCTMSKELLLAGKTYTGTELQDQAGSLIVTDDVFSEALNQASRWVKLPLETVRTWKKAQTSLLKKTIEELPVWLEEQTKTSELLPKTITDITLSTKVIKAKSYPKGIIEVTMEDREAKNMFSDAFIAGMIEVFMHIEEHPSYKVVVLTGYDNYFASGGTKDSLLAIQEGKAKFTDTKIFELALDCKIPVISAMQGHGIGAGWSMGMFSDFVLFSEESRYVSPYMKYGFTPGAGATLIFPDKIGYDLSRETLLRGVEYSGKALQDKRMSFPVFPRKKTHSAALVLARQITRYSRKSLVGIKDQLTAHLKKRLETTYSHELAMHETTFVGRQDTLQQIESHFYQDSTISKEAINATEKSPAVNIEDTVLRIDELPDIISDLKKLLAKELHLSEDEIDENSQFVDLGLDSIVGVTFIRTINEKYDLSLQATIVYSYATLAALGTHIKEVSEKQGISVSRSVTSTITDIPKKEPEANTQSIFPNILLDLKKLLAKELHLSEDEIDDNSQFVDLGLDSIVGVTFIHTINEKYGLSLQATIVYSYSTLSALSDHIQDKIKQKGVLITDATVSADIPEKVFQSTIPKAVKGRRLTSLRKGLQENANQFTKSSSRSQSIAVIGMAGQFPEAGDVESFWQNIAQGKNCIREIPKKRWDIEKYYQAGETVEGKTYSKWMGALEDYDLFDPMFFNISPIEAESMDPQQRLFLETCWHTIEHAGYNPHVFSGSKCGVYVGCAAGDYLQQSKKHQLSAQGFTGAAGSILASRISYFLNLQGPCVSIDTACSSSLVAIANACDALVSGSIDSALAGGVYIMATPSMHIMSSQSGMLSPDGRCHTFDQRANGFVPGEGVGVVMLKRLEDAEKDNDTILGVVQGWGINQDGKTNGITAPNTESQIQLEQQVYDQFDVDPNNIQLIETHGTATKLGDPIEVEGLRRSFQKYTEERAYCALGSVKSNIGHCLTAAGVAGFIKVLQAMKHKQLPPTINFEQLNEHINLEGSPFYVNTELRDWEVRESQQRQAAISSFGFSGTNAHLVMGEYVSQNQEVVKRPVQVITQNSDFIVPLSAKSEEQLKQKASDLLKFIKEEKGELDLVDMAYTLQVGREAMEERLGFMVRDIDQLTEKLRAYSEGEDSIRGVYLGQVKRNKEGLQIISNDDEMKETIVDNYISQKKLSKLLDLWVKGLELDWNKLYGDHKPKRINLPLYPFARERYWIEKTVDSYKKENKKALEVLHPLVHKNTSDLRQQSYNTIFDGEEFFIKENKIQGNKALPGLACLEMARAAMILANAAQDESAVIELHHVFFTKPIVVEETKEVRIALFAGEEEGHVGEQISVEIYSTEEEQEIYFQGQVTYSHLKEPATLDILQLKDEMKKIALKPKDIYTDLSKRGHVYGSTLRGISCIYQGDNQLLAEVSIPLLEENDQKEFVLYPSIMEGVMQACIGLVTDIESLSQPLFPTSLNAIRILSSCTKEMNIWVRIKDIKTTNHILDIDLIDQQGNICIEMRGLSLQSLGEKTNASENVEKAIEVYQDKFDDTVLQREEVSQELFFKEYWQDQPLTFDTSLPDSKQLIIFADKEFKESIINSDNTGQFTKAIFVFQEQKYEKVSENFYHCRSNNVSDIQKVLKGVNDKSNKSIGLIYTWAKNNKEKGIHALFNVFNAIKRFDNPVDITLVGNYNPSSVETCWDYSWIGFERSLKLVLPNSKISLLYTDSSGCTPQQLLDAVQHPGVIWYKDQQRFELSYRPFDLSDTTKTPVLRKNGSYLITGGIGKLGFELARYLAKEYQAKLLLLGRRPLVSEIQEKIDQLKQEGAKEVYYYSVDISNRKAITSWAKNLPFNLSGIIHTAGVEGSEVFYEKTTKSINEVLQPKSKGIMVLDEILNEQPLDFVCYFSSSAAMLGDFGSCDYAIANRFLMAYAYYREQKNQNNGKSVVINWPFWKDGGMGKGDFEQAAFYLKSSGQDVLETSEGITIWNDIIQSNQTQTLVLKGKPNRVEQFLDRTYAAEPLDQLPSNIQNQHAHMGKGWKVQYQDLLLQECVYADLIKLVSTNLKIPSEKLDGVTNLADYGFDSISLTTFAKELRTHFFITITPAVFYNYSTIKKLSDYFVQDYRNHLEEFYNKPQSKIIERQQVDAKKPVLKKTAIQKRFLQTKPKNTSYFSNLAQEPIAIIGMSGRFPGADTADQLWEMLEKGESGISEIPLSRWDWRDYFSRSGGSDNKISTNKGGFINNVDEFDPLFFEITPREAEAMDPGQRMLLIEAYKAIEDAQIDPSSLRGTPVGVFAGMEESQYNSLISDEQGVGNSGNAMISSRLSYYLDLQGPTIATNTACSSGLVAMHQAIMSLRNRECESALVAGISSLILSPEFYVKMSQAGMLSQDGQCYSFAKKANGIGASEAIVVLMLKPLSAAIEAGNPIYGTIKASGINFDGKTNGVTAPSGKSQEALIKNVYTNYSINPQDISHIIAHGTGTKLGDPIELNALNDAFKKLIEKQPDSKQTTNCAITSCKSNLGHTMAASGLVSVVSLLKGLQHNKIPATINCEEENDYISWENSPFYINKITTEWKKEQDKPRMGGISSFGRSGTNAHVVIEEYTRPITPQFSSVVHPREDAQIMIVLSAKTEEQLLQKVSDLLTLIKNPDQTIDLLSIAYSLQVTREVMEIRLGCIVNSVEELVDKLQAYLNSEKNIESFYRGEAKHYDTSISIFNSDTDLQETIDKWIANKKLLKVLELWVKGLELDWNKLYGEVKPKCIGLPKYPFAKERYWIKKTTSKHVIENTPVAINKNYEIIENLVDQIENESITTDQAIGLLKKYSTY
ncbi:SDR family NAD(P)-dependent oxidoreductase [Aquimarina spinulae]|uniref:SDR family NAD(P)-dependent oxidoreductase n=1 Tax=Aquimarina spinulae TaxID=1192023 RepID=UPI000D5542F7|nr:SDR family NAD(P)-dependent oxidoreductase [Aquimarina spinulae]